MANESAQIINASRSSSKHVFREALEKALNDLYKKDASTNIRRIYDTLAEQFKDIDIELKRALADQWISMTRRNELCERGFSTYDRLQEEGAFELNYIGFVPENNRVFNTVTLASLESVIQLDRIPSDTPQFTLLQGEKDISSVVLGYDASTNQIILDGSKIEGGEYTFGYTDKGCTLERNEILTVSKNDEGLITVTVAGDNVLYDSERVVIQNSAIGVLVRGEDYIFDYETGTLTAIADGRISTLNPTELDISYRFCFDFETYTKTAFHEQVFNEAAQIIDEVTIRVNSTYVSEVFRIFNATKREIYEPQSISRGIITLRPENRLKLIHRKNQSVQIFDTVFKTDIATKQLFLPVPSQEGLNSIQSVANVQGTSSLLRIVDGGRQNVPQVVTLNVFYETKSLSLFTGGIEARRCNVTLREGTHYTLRADTPSTFTITFLQAGLDKIGRNSLYAQLNARVSAINQRNDKETRNFRFDIRVTPPSEIYPVTGNLLILENAYTYVAKGNNGDVPLTEEIVVSTVNGETVFEQGTDYVWNGITKVIEFTAGSRIRLEDNIRVSFLGIFEFSADYLTLPDVLVVDYDKTQNGIDWTASLQTFDIRIRKVLSPNENVVELVYHPDDPEDLPRILIYLASDPTQRLRALTYNRRDRLLVVEAPEFEGDYVIEYVGHKHFISPSVNYYVSYNYGGRDRALRNVWSPLLGLTDTERRRYEQKNLNGNQSSVVLDYPPTDLDEIVIFLRGDTENEPATTITDFDPNTNTLYFNPVRAFGTYYVAYNTSNALTEDLRKFIIGMIGAFLTGPTKTGIEKMIETFTDITPDVRLATELAFKLRDEVYNSDPNQRSDSLMDIGFKSENIDFVPSRYNTGYQATVSNQTKLFTTSLTNVRAKEGTIQFLIGPRFNGDEPLTKYFIDIGQEGQYYRNRMAIYKNQKGYLVFETHDNEGQLWRVASDIKRNRTRITVPLAKGITSYQLNPPHPAFVTTDLDNDGQYDFFGAHKTEFLIRRIPGDTTEEGYGYSPLQFSEGYGYSRDDILLGRSVDLTTPVNIVVHFQIPDEPSNELQVGFDDVTRKLQAVVQAVKTGGGKVVVHTSVSYLRGNETFSNVLKAIENAGHEIGLYVDYPKFITNEVDRAAYLAEGFEIAQRLGITLESASANSKSENWAQLLISTGLNIVSGYIDPIFGETFENRAPTVRRVRSAETQGVLDLEGGELVYLPGVTHLNLKKPFSRATLQQIESTLLRTFSLKNSTEVSSWYFTVTPGNFSGNYFSEAALITEFIQTTINPLIELKKVRWSSFNTTAELFKALENWLNSLDAEAINTIGRDTYVKVLSYDYDTRTVTFDPIPSDGLYEFDYVTGWTAYEESEIFVSAVYKFRTDDGALPFYKLYINGELQDFVTFADFPALGEG